MALGDVRSKEGGPVVEEDDDDAGSTGAEVGAPFQGTVPFLAMVVEVQCCDEILSYNHYKIH